MKKFTIIGAIFILLLWALNINFFSKDKQPFKKPQEIGKKDYAYYLNRIKKDREWMLQIKKEAKYNNLSVDSVLSKTAHEWEIKAIEKTKSKVKDYIYYLKRIKKDEKWMEYIKKEAEVENLSVDSILSKTALEWEKNISKL